MVMKSYRSECPNHVHQVIVSASKHYFVTRRGAVKYQKKPIDVHIHTLHKVTKIHIVEYLIRDHFSGLIYAELCCSNELLSIDEFLFRAWAQKDDYMFCGIPRLLTLPRTVEIVFPGIRDRLELLGIHVARVTSGFQGGIGDIKIIEDHIGYLPPGTTFEDAKREMPNVCQRLASRASRNGRDNKISLWRNNVGSVVVPERQW